MRDGAKTPTTTSKEVVRTGKYRSGCSCYVLNSQDIVERAFPRPELVFKP